MGRRKYSDFETMIYKGVSEGIREIQRARHLDDKSMAEDVFHKAETTFRGYKYMATGLDIVDLYQLCNNENVCLDRLVGLRKEFNLFRDSSNANNPMDLIVELENILYSIEVSGTDNEQIIAAASCSPYVARWLERLCDRRNQ
jgi:hypothetical protein